MLVDSIQITFDCADPDRLARWWAAALGYVLPPPPTGHETWEDWLRAADIPEESWNDAAAIEDPAGVGPRIYFQKVPEPKAVKNRVHLDLAYQKRGMSREERRRSVGERVQWLIEHGATAVGTADDHKGYAVVMQDPEGNEFCVH